MPPVTKDEPGPYSKDVEFVEKDEDEQIGVGIVMVPDKADLQYDFVREATIRDFADQFETFQEAGESDGGIMHAVWPSDWMELERNEVLDEAEEIGGVEAPAGAWVQAWRFNEDQLWELVKDEILGGYSIGAVDVRWDGPYEQDALDAVEIPDELDDAAGVWEIQSGIIREVSAVDIPAVPDALIHETKADAEKRLGNYLPDPNGFIEEAVERGHSEEEAERLWDVLSDAVEIEGAGEPGEKSLVGRLLSAISTGSGSKAGGESGQPDREKGSRDKEGRTLSTQNRHNLFASIDAAADVLEDAGIDHGIERFTDRDEWDFDLSEHQAREWPDDEEEGDEDENSNPFDVDNANEQDATEGETSESGSTDAADNMSDETDNTTENSGDAWDDAPEWAKELRDNQEQNSKRLDEQAEQIEAALEANEEPKTAEIEIGGETVEVTEEQAKSWFDEQSSDDPFDDAPEWAKSLKEQQEQTAQRVDRITQQSGIGGSDQLDAAATRAEENNDESALDDLGKALS